MRLFLLASAMMLCVASIAAAECDVAEAGRLYAEADALLARTFDIPTFNKAGAILEKAVGLCPDHVKSLVLLSQVRWETAERLPRDQGPARRALYEKGIDAAKRARELEPNNAAAIFWEATNRAGVGDVQGWASSLKMYPSMMRDIERVEELDPHYLCGATDRFRTEVLVRVPLFLANRFGHDPKALVAGLEEEIQREPRYLANYVYVARLLWKMDEHDRALDRLSEAITRDPAALPAFAGDNGQEQRLARELWREFTGKDHPAR